MEPVGATAAIIGIVSFGLSLAESLRTFIGLILEAEETIKLIIGEIEHGTHTLKNIDNLINQDKVSSQESNRATVFNDDGPNLIGECASQCQKIYEQILSLFEKAGIHTAEDEGKDTGPQASVAADKRTPKERLEAFSKNVFKLSHKIRWPSLEPQVKRCQEHLARRNIQLVFGLLLFAIGEIRANRSVVGVVGTDNENELTDRARIVQRRLKKSLAKGTSPNQPKRQPPGSKSLDSIVPDDEWIINNASTHPVDSSNMPDHVVDGSSTNSSDLEPIRLPGIFPFTDRKGIRALLNIRKRLFTADSKSSIFEAFLIQLCSRSDLHQHDMGLSQYPMKMPFDNHKLTLEVKQALRKHNPWEILVALRPDHLKLVGEAIQHVQHAADRGMSVYLVAIDIDGYDDMTISQLVARRSRPKMILFFRYEAVSVREEEEYRGQIVIRESSSIVAAIRTMLIGTQRKREELRELRAKVERYVDRKAKIEEDRLEIAEDRAENGEDRLEIEKCREEIAEDRHMIENDREEIKEAKKELQAERIRIREENKAIEIKDRAFKSAGEAVLNGIAGGVTEQELKKIFEEKAAGDDRLPVKFKDAAGRKFEFPFHMVQTWQGMEDLIKEASLQVGTSEQQPEQGHCDLMDSEGQIILPSVWAATVKPGMSVFMRTRHWRLVRRDTHYPPAPASMSIEPSQWSPPPTPRPIPPPPPFHHAPPPPPLQHFPPRPFPPQIIHQGGPPPRPFPPQPFPPQPFPPPLSLPTVGPSMPVPVKIDSKSRAKKFRGGISRAETSRRKTVHVSEYDEDLEQIDKELGLDELEALEQMASKDIDELLADWTKPAEEEHEGSGS